MHAWRDCDLHGRTTGNGATEHCLLLSPSTTHTTRGRLGRVCAVHSPRLPKAQAAFRLSLLAPLFAQCFFFNDFVFLCVVVGQNQSSTAASGFLGGFGSAHSSVTGRLPLPPGWHFVGTHPSLRAVQTALKKCVEVGRSVDFSFFFFATILPSALYAIQATAAV